MFTTAGFQGGASPDRVDALVWALTELMLGTVSHGGLFEFMRQEAEALKAEKEGATNG